MGDLVQPGPGCRIPARELAPVVNTAKTMPGMGWRKAIAIQVKKNGEKQQAKAARQAKSRGVQPGERHEGMIWWRTKGERWQEWGDGMVIASKQAEPAAAVGRGRK